MTPVLGNLDNSTVTTNWRKDRRLIREGFKDLEYLPGSKTGWNATLTGYAFSVRKAVTGQGDLNLWAGMHSCPPSKRYTELGDDGLVLWHGTTAGRAEKIRQVGLVHKRGVWATTEPRIAHSFTRGRSGRFRAGSAMIVLLISKTQWEGKADRESDSVVRFHTSVPPQEVEYVICDERIEFLGAAKARSPKPWGIARFCKRGGKWVPVSRPPVRFDRHHTYNDLDEWLDLSIRRIVTTLGGAAAIETFSSLYATIRPIEALEHKRIFAALDKLCDTPRQGRGGIKLFTLREGE